MKKLAQLMVVGVITAQPLLAQGVKASDLKAHANSEQKSHEFERRMKDAEFRLQQSKDEMMRKRLYKRYLESQALKDSGITSQYHGGVEVLGGAVALKFLTESCIQGWRAGASYCNHGRAIYKIASEFDQNLGQLFRTMVDNDGDIHKNHASEVNQYAGVIDDIYRYHKGNARDFVSRARFASILVTEAVRKFAQGGAYFNRGRDLASQFSEVSKHVSYAISSMTDNDGDIHNKHAHALRALESILEDLKNTPDHGGGNHGGGHGNQEKVLSVRKARYLINMLEVDRDIEGAVRVLRRAIERLERENGSDEDW